MNDEDVRIADELRALPKERTVSEAQTAALRARLPRPRSPRKRIVEIALAASLAAAAFLAGRVTARADAPAAPQPNYVLLVHDDLVTPPDPNALHAEYARWANRLGERGKLAGGEELGDAPIMIAARGTGSASTVGGYFLLTARDEADAIAIARDCPHLRHGGTLELRKVVRR